RFLTYYFIDRDRVDVYWREGCISLLDIFYFLFRSMIYRGVFLYYWRWYRHLFKGSCEIR
ncbi:MAG: hypothetical protein ACTSRA_20985, partial [Promethearchaeota archaeon]